jgi:hypothetical protein
MTMRSVALTAVALALTAAAGSAQATGPYLPYNHIQGIGDMSLPHVRVSPDPIKVAPKLNIENGVEFGQYNTGDMTSIQGFASVGPKKVTGTSAAIGNTANVDVKGGVLVEGNQKNYGDMMARQGALVLGAKKVELTSAAIGNTTNVVTKGDAVVDMNQVNTGTADSRQISAVLSPFGRDLGKVEITSAAIGNSLSVEFGEKEQALVSSRQANLADATSINLTAVVGRFDSADITSAAIGNALNITNR